MPLRTGKLPFLVVLLSALLTLGVIAWTTVLQAETFHESMWRIMRAAVEASAADVTRHVHHWDRMLEALARDNQDLLSAIHEQPNDETLQKRFDARLRPYFPDYLAFALVDAQGDLIPDDLGVRVGDFCRRDIAAFLDANRNTDGRIHPRSDYAPFIHPQPFDYHFDTMTIWKNRDGIDHALFVSLRASTLSSILANHQMPDYQVLLMHDAITGLIEIGAAGSRDMLDRAAILTAEEMAEMSPGLPVAGTHWRVAALPRPDLFADHERALWTRSGLIMAAVLLLFTVAALWVRQAEARRQAVLDQLNLLNESLEERVVERTLDLQRATDVAFAAHQAKSDFFANMSHELRTPLNAILGFTDALRLRLIRPESPQYAEYLENISHSSHQLLDLITELLDLSSIESGLVDLQDEILYPNEVFERAAILLHPLTVRARVRLRLDVPTDLPRLRADSRRVKQMLTHLVENAVMHSREGDCVTISAAVGNDNGLRIAVGDTGSGMSADEVERALSPFGLGGKDAYVRTSAGAGLGLPIARYLIEAHGGRMELASEIGKGTEVTLLFPAERSIVGPPSGGPLPIPPSPS